MMSGTEKWCCSKIEFAEINLPKILNIISEKLLF